MSETLYRRYRPSRFADVVNQDHIKKILQNELVSGNHAQAYLFYGSRGIGKTTLARIFAKALICEKRAEKKYEPCDSCSSCNSVKTGNNLDVIEMDAATHTQVDKVRENIIEASRSLPSSSNFKIFIIDEVHMLSNSSFNALLKIVEEPPEHVVFILATTEVHKVPQTVLSRCERFDFKKITHALTVKRLQYIVKEEKRLVDEDALEEIAGSSDGALRDAETLLGKVLVLEGKKITLKDASFVLPVIHLEHVTSLATALISKDMEVAFSTVQKLSDNGDDLKRTIDALLELMRDILITLVTKKESENENVRLWLKENKNNISLEQIKLIIDAGISAKQKMKYESILTLPLELMIVELCYLDTIRSDESGNEKLSKPVLRKSLETSPSPTTLTKKAELSKAKESLPASKPSKNLSEIIDQWQNVINHASKENASLGVILRLTKPIEYTKNILKLGITYQLHFDKLKSNNVKSLLESILKNVFGKSITIEPVLHTEDKENKEDMSSLAEAFGGKII